ncbi:MAG: hypothetical protein ACK2TV_04910 [Anaerolineales bacterium]
MPLITLFTAPKPFLNPHISTIQRNTLNNWKALGEEVEVVVIGDEPGIEETCTQIGLRHLSDVRCNVQGTPLISSIFEFARGVNNSPYLVYANADIIFFPDIIDAIRTLSQSSDLFLGIGQRWDLDITEEISYSTDWVTGLQQRLKTEAKLHGQTGSDYFVFPRACFQDIPDFAVGRAGWDNWMIFKARSQHWPVIDMTQTVTIIHQNHDYAHLPGGEIHYRLPESMENIALGGGRRTIFNLTDATHALVAGERLRKPLTWKTFWREVEIFPLISLHSRWLGWLSFAVFHPKKAFQEFKSALVKMIRSR